MAQQHQQRQSQARQLPLHPGARPQRDTLRATDAAQAALRLYSEGQISAGHCTDSGEALLCMILLYWPQKALISAI